MRGWRRKISQLLVLRVNKCFEFVFNKFFLLTIVENISVLPMKSNFNNFMLDLMIFFFFVFIPLLCSIFSSSLLNIMIENFRSIWKSFWHSREWNTYVNEIAQLLFSENVWGKKKVSKNFWNERQNLVNILSKHFLLLFYLIWLISLDAHFINANIFILKTFLAKKERKKVRDKFQKLIWFPSIGAQMMRILNYMEIFLSRT